jgi:predicted nuclease of predicted toxin-antitoxin system
VRILLDGNIPRAFAALLPGHRIDTVHRRRWSDVDDGALLAAAESEYDAFLTMDQNLRFQKNLRGRRLRVVLVRAPRNTLPVLAPIASSLLDALAAMDAGDFRVVGI